MPEQSATHPAQSTLQSHLAHWRGGVLYVLALATLMMPVSYRAGTDSSHPHTIFQSMIDAVAGQSHSHGKTSSSPARQSPSPFAPLALPLVALPHTNATVDHVHHPDSPAMLQLSSPIIDSAAILLLGLIVARLLGFAPYRHVWAASHALHPMPASIETPPPRLA